MKRDPKRLVSERFDVIVVGAGIHGACVARDVALRGLRVAVIERGDLGGETSHNSLKTIHGGIRYIQHLNFTRTRESIREQTIWLRTAPHLVRPLPFLMPTYGHGLRGPAAMFAGIQIYRSLGLRRNAGLVPQARIRPGRVMGIRAARAMVPDVPGDGLSGAALWDDAQVRFADRAVIEILSDASAHGAAVLNHAEATAVLKVGVRAAGVRVIDRLSGAEFEVAGRLVVNAAGPWAAALATDLPASAADVPLTRSMNIVTRRPPRDFALSIKSDEASDSKLGATKRLFFEVPWEGCTIFGTTYAAAGEGADTPDLQAVDIADFLADLNAAWPALGLTLDEVVYCYRGLTPAEIGEGSQRHSHESRILDHVQAGGLDGLISIIGVKWTTARLVAERAVDLAAAKLGVDVPCCTRDAPLPPLAEIGYDLAGRPERDIVKICRAHIERTLTLTLRDMLLRRTDDLVRGRLSVDEIACVARCMRAHLGWDATACARQAALLCERWLPPETRRVFETSDALWGTT
ncbi:MAG: FAD-dependent oxidoreductase [Pseudomonadota bacterium]